MIEDDEKLSIEERLNHDLHVAEQKLRTAEEKIEELEERIRGIRTGWMEQRDMEDDGVLPVPRFEISWRKTYKGDSWYNRTCEYRLVHKHLLGHLVVIPLGSTRVSGGPPGEVPSPFEEIKENDWDLSINRYKEIEYEEVEYASPAEIIREIELLDKERELALATLREMLDE